MDRPLPAGTTEIDRRQSISTINFDHRRSIEGDNNKTEKKKREKKEKKRRNIPSREVPRVVRRLRDSSPAGEESPASDSFSSRGETERPRAKNRQQAIPSPRMGRWNARRIHRPWAKNRWQAIL
ncbi:hypothetical protein B296_00059213, partial [Ensete ventricosum]